MLREHEVQAVLLAQHKPNYCLQVGAVGCCGGAARWAALLVSVAEPHFG